MAASRGVYADESYQQLFKELAKVVSVEEVDLINQGEQAKATIGDPVKKQQMQTALTALSSSQKHFANISEMLAATAQDAQCKSTIEKTGKAVEQNAAYLVTAARSANLDPKYVIILLWMRYIFLSTYTSIFLLWIIIIITGLFN